jgi:hypothetical protein
MRGHEAYLIRYLPGAPCRSAIVLKLAVKRVLALVWPKMRQSLQKQLQSERLLRKNRARDFEGFRRQYLQLTERVYRNSKELIITPPKADCYITGSDQVWSRDMGNVNTRGWYLQFGNSSVRRVSYAASMSRPLKTDEVPLFAEFLRGFHAVSVREESLRKDCERCGIHGVQVTVDPTLLLDSTAYPIANARQDGAYMLLYVLNVRSADELYWTSVESYLSLRGLRPRIVYSSGCIPATELIEDHPGELLTIPDWLAAIRDARCVMTTSFHGVVFSIILHRPVLAILLTNEYAGGNCRIVDLLGKLGLSDRILDPEKNVAEQMEQAIDWERVESVLKNLRQESVDFLTESLREVDR